MSDHYKTPITKKPTSSTSSGTGSSRRCNSTNMQSSSNSMIPVSPPNPTCSQLLIQRVFHWEVQVQRWCQILLDCRAYGVSRQIFRQTYQCDPASLETLVFASNSKLPWQYHVLMRVWLQQNCPFEGTSHLSRLWPLIVFSGGTQVWHPVPIVFIILSRIFSSLSYPIGIKNTLNSLKWMA